MQGLPFVAPWGPVAFKQKFAKHLMLAPQELPVIDQLLATARPIRRRHDIIIEGRRSHMIYLVVDGFLMRYRILRNGQRQVINLAIPGDIAGSPGCFFDTALYSIRTLTDAIVCAIPLDDVFDLLVKQPRLATKLLWLLFCESAISTEHLVVVGRRSARERIAHFFLELLIRLKAIGLASENSFSMPFSQDVISDALGLSLAYVNRELRSLADEGLVLINDRQVSIGDVTALSEMADFEHRYLKPSPASQFFAQAPVPPTPAARPDVIHIR